jgi:hypothetical protein
MFTNTSVMALQWSASAVKEPKNFLFRLDHLQAFFAVLDMPTNLQAAHSTFFFKSTRAQSVLYDLPLG